jgi:hypothetical protein
LYHAWCEPALYSSTCTLYRSEYFHSTGTTSAGTSTSTVNKCTSTVLVLRTLLVQVTLEYRAIASTLSRERDYLAFTGPLGGDGRRPAGQLFL